MAGKKEEEKGETGKGGGKGQRSWIEYSIGVAKTNIFFFVM